MPPLREEYGGDGRTLQDALREAKDPVYRASLKLAQIAEKHKARLEALGYEIVVKGAGTSIKGRAKAQGANRLNRVPDRVDLSQSQ
jgi:hypothetical protein